MICENIKCKKEHDGSYGSGRFCSFHCSRSRNFSKETKEKMSKISKEKLKNSEKFQEFINRKKKCLKCGRKISFINYSKHYKSCNGIIGNKTDKYKQKDGIYKCPHCSKIYSKFGIQNHIDITHLHKKIFKKGRIAWNKGLTKETDERVKKLGRTYSNRLKSGEISPSFKGKKHTIETKNKISKAMSINNKGGRCKWYSVGGIMVQGTWERNLAIKMTLLNIEWDKIKTNSKTFCYIMNEKRKHYTPDFYLEEYKIYLEIKGFWYGDDKEKIECVLNQCKIPLVVIEKKLYNKLLNCLIKDNFIKYIMEA